MSVTGIRKAEVEKKFASYPDPIRERLLLLRQLILETATEMADVAEIEETLKWGEPSYVTKNGSTIRIGWKDSKPEQTAMYFNCRTTLVETFKELFRGQLNFEGNRAIVFGESEEIPIVELRQCISLALTYHRVKHLSLLGV